MRATKVDRVSLLSWLSAASAIWVFFSPLVCHDIPAALVNNVCVGFAMAFLTLLSAFRPNWHRGVSWVNSLLAFWLVLSPFILGYSQRRGTPHVALPMWNDVVFGCLICFLSYFSRLYAADLEEVG